MNIKEKIEKIEEQIQELEDKIQELKELRPISGKTRGDPKVTLY